MGNVFASNEGADPRISKFDAFGVFQGWIGAIDTNQTTNGWASGIGTSTYGSGDTMLRQPTSLDVDSSGNIYVVDGLYNFRVQKFNSAGVFQGWLGKRESDGATGSWFVGDRAAYSTSAGGLASPLGAHVDGVTSRLYVTDTAIDKIKVFNSDASYVTDFGSSGNGDGQFDVPLDVETDSSGNIYVADRYRVEKSDAGSHPCCITQGFLFS